MRRQTIKKHKGTRKHRKTRCCKTRRAIKRSSGGGVKRKISTLDDFEFNIPADIDTHIVEQSPSSSIGSIYSNISAISPNVFDSPQSEIDGLSPSLFDSPKTSNELGNELPNELSNDLHNDLPNDLGNSSINITAIQNLSPPNIKNAGRAQTYRNVKAFILAHHRLPQYTTDPNKRDELMLYKRLSAIQTRPEMAKLIQMVPNHHIVKWNAMFQQLQDYVNTYHALPSNDNPTLKNWYMNQARYTNKKDMMDNKNKVRDYLKSLRQPCSAIHPCAPSTTPVKPPIIRRPPQPKQPQANREFMDSVIDMYLSRKK